MAAQYDTNQLRVLYHNDKIPSVSANELTHIWQASSLERRRILKTYFNEKFASLIESPTHNAEAGNSTAPVIYEGRVTSQDKRVSHAFFFVKKSTKYNRQDLGEMDYPQDKVSIPVWHTMLPDALAREKAASDLVEAGLTPHFCLVYKTVVQRSPDMYLSFTRYTEFAGRKTVTNCLDSDAKYRTSLAFELHAKLQVATAIAVALKHVETTFYQGDLHPGNVVVQPLTSDDEGVPIPNPFCASYKSRFLFRIIDFISDFAPLNYGAAYEADPFYNEVFTALFRKQRYALADILAFYYQFDVTAFRKDFSILTQLSFTYVKQNMKRKEADVARGLAQMLLTFYEDPPGAETMYGAKRRRRGASTRRKSSRSKSSRRRRRSSRRK